MDLDMVWRNRASRDGEEASRLAFSAFLSHRYNSSTVNKFFFRIFSGIADVQFTVDARRYDDRNIRAPTNVTRLERMIRDSDCFVGIFPVPIEQYGSISRADLEAAARYFQLEVSIAIRMSKPSIVFVDERYGDIIRVPPPMIECRYNWQEAVQRSPAPLQQLVRDRFESFCRAVEISMAMKRQTASLRRAKTTVGIIVPTKGAKTGGSYSRIHIDMIQQAVQTRGGSKARVLPWPLMLDAETESILEEIDYVVVDVGHISLDRDVVGYLHGRGIPALRLHHLGGKKRRDQRRTALGGLYRAFRAGYPTDILVWTDPVELRHGIFERVSNILHENRRISEFSEADEYFDSAALSNEKVFVSYRGVDLPIASRIINAIKTKYSTVFDYKDEGESIPPGSHWLPHIFESLKASRIAVLLTSEAYFESGNCFHEAEYAAAAEDGRKSGPSVVIPVRLYQNDPPLPAFLGNLQALKAWQYDKPGELEQAILTSISSALTRLPIQKRSTRDPST